MTRLLGAALLFLAAAMLSQTSYANDCESAYNIGDTARSNITSNCHSEHYTNYDPYNPSPYLAKYFRFSLERDADVKFEASGPGRMYLIRGTNRTGTVIKSTTNRVMKLHLSTGDYILEYANSYTSNFTLVSSFNDTGNTTCVNALTFGNTVHDGWVPGCSSNNRDIADPYSPVPDQGHRAKYFTFTLEQDSDIAVSVTSEVSPYIYILEGHGEFGAIQQEISGNSSNIFLTAGQYTVELTTQNRYDPGQFELIVSEIASGATCERAINFNETISEAWSPTCNIRSWIPGNSDPYAGQNPERAKYYTFALNDASDIRFSLQPGNSNKTLLNLYRAGNYGSKVASTHPSTPWSTPATSISEHLASGDYVLEVTQFNQTAIGSFSIQAEKLTSECNINVPYSGSPVSIESRLSSNCTTEFRGIDGVFDPYGVQQGTYYAKRFEFTLENTAAVRIAASGQQSSYLYLAKKGELDNLVITESYGPNHWSTTTSPSVTRELAPGTYIAEITSHYPGRSFDIRFSLSSASSSCELSAMINERKNAQLDSRCEAKSKDSVRNPNPYSSPDHFRYYAKRFTFEVRESKTYEISVNSSGFGAHAFLMRGGDYKGELIDDFYTTSSGKLSRDFTLSPGIYTLEVTSTDHNRSGTVGVLVWDKTTEVSSHCLVNIEMLNDSVLKDQLVSTCPDGRRGSNHYYKHYEFNITADSTTIDALVTQASFDSYMYLLQKQGNNWITLESDDDDGSGNNARIIRSLNKGTYRIEITSLGSRIEAEFSAKIVALKDSDQDGIYDHIDPAPNTAYQCTRNLDIRSGEAVQAFSTPGCKEQDENIAVNYFNFELSETNNIELVITDISTYHMNYSLLLLDGEQWRVVSNRSSADSSIWKKLKPGKYRIVFSTGIHTPVASFTFRTTSLPDTDQDGVYDRDDAFPQNPNETADNDKDGLGDIIDPDDDNDGIIDILDSQPTYANSKAASQPILVIGETTVDEGSSLVLTLLRNRDYLYFNRFSYYTYDKTAKAGEDYTPAIGSINFSEKQTVTVTIATKNDETNEGNENLALVIFPDGYNTATGQVVPLTITDDLAENRVSFAQPAQQINEDMGFAQIKVSRSGDLSKAQAVFYRSQDGSAIALQDYIPVSGKLEFAADERQKNISVPLIKDEFQEPSEFFTVQLFDANGIAINSSTLRFTTELAVDSDTTYSLMASNAENVIPERLNNHQVVVQRSGSLEKEATVRINLIQERKGATSTTPAAAHFAKGAKFAYVPVNWYTNYDSDYREQHLTIEMVSAVPAGQLDNSSVNWSFAPVIKNHSYGHNPIIFSNGTTTANIAEAISSTLMLIRPLQRAEINYQLKTSDWSVYGDEPHIQHLEEDFWFDENSNSKELTINPVDNSEYQQHHGFAINITGNSNSYLVVNIEDNEDLFTPGNLTFSSRTVIADEALGKAGFIIQRTLGNSGEISARLSTRDGTALAGTHYKAQESQLVFNNGEFTRPGAIELINDGVKTSDLYFYVDLAVDLGNGKTTTDSLKISIMDSSTSPKRSSDAESSDSDSAGALQWMWLLLLALPLTFVRIRRL